MEEGQQQQQQQQRQQGYFDGPSPSQIRRTILLTLFLIIIPCLWYYYLIWHIVPQRPSMELNSMVVERSVVPEGNEVSKWHTNLTVRNPEMRWQGSFREVRFKLLKRENNNRRRGIVLGVKAVEPFRLGCDEGLQITLNMDVMDALEGHRWYEDTFALRINLKSSYEDTHESFVGDYWDVRIECAGLRFKFKRGKGKLINHVPTTCNDNVQVIPHRAIYKI